MIVGLCDNYIKKRATQACVYSINIYWTYLVLTPVLGNRDAAKNLKIPVAMEATF